MPAHQKETPRSVASYCRAHPAKPVSRSAGERRLGAEDARVSEHPHFRWKVLSERDHAFRSRSALMTTETELKLIATAAMMGESRMPKKG